jgi:hypothetical protein
MLALCVWMHGPSRTRARPHSNWLLHRLGLEPHTRARSSREHPTDPNPLALPLTVSERSIPRRCGLWLPPVNATSPSQGYTLLSRAILYSQGLLTLKGYPISRATQSQGLLTLKGATHSQGGYSLSRGPLVAPLPLGPLSVGLLSLALPPLALLPLTLLPPALLPIAVLPIALPPIALPPITLSTIALHSIDRRSLPPLSL